MASFTSSHVSKLSSYIHADQTIAHEDYVDLLNVFSNFSPPPSEMLKIPMNSPVNVEQLKEIIIYTLRTRYSELTCRTWKRILRFFADDRYNDMGKRENCLRYESLLAFSKIDQKELYRTAMNKFRSPRHCFNTQVADLIEELMERVEIFNITDLYSSAVISSFKDFLLNRPIIEAMVQCLGYVFGGSHVSEERVKSEIAKMEVHLSPGIGNFCGLAGHDGIILFGTENHGMLVLSSNYPQDSARIFTILCHEAIHYIARIIADDLNFSSPSSAISEPAPPRMDVVIENKQLELGRYLELVLFDNIQPDWTESSVRAAKEFLSRAKNKPSPPLFSKAEHYTWGIRERRDPSISFGAELIYWKKPQVVPDRYAIMLG